MVINIIILEPEGGDEGKPASEVQGDLETGVSNGDITIAEGSIVEVAEAVGAPLISPAPGVV